MQLLGETPGVAASQVQVARLIVQKEGVVGLYQGLSAAIMRQATYTTLRLGAYDVVKTWFTKETLASRVGSAAGAGAFASLVRFVREACLVGHC